MRYLLDTNLLVRSVDVARIAAAAYVHGLDGLVTFNDADFRRFGRLQVIHPRSVQPPTP